MATQFDATKNDLIVSLAQKYLSDSILMRPYVKDLSMFAVKGAKTISIPKLSGFTVNNRAFNVAGSSQTLNDAVDTIAIDKNAFLQWSEDHSDIIQSTLEYRMMAVERAAKAQGSYVDAQIISGLESVAGLSINGATPADVTNADVLDMREYIMNAGGVEAWNDAVYFVSTDSDKALLKLDQFSKADVYGNSNIPSGVIGYIYGAPVVVHNAIKSQQIICFSKEGYGVAFQRELALAEQDDISIGTQGKKVVMDQLFGTGGLQLEERGAAAGKSPLVAILTD